MSLATEWASAVVRVVRRRKRLGDAHTAMEPPLDDDATQPPEEEDLTDPPFTAAEVLTDPDVLASIMGQLGLRLANLTAATRSAWKHAGQSAPGGADGAPAVALAFIGATRPSASSNRPGHHHAADGNLWPPTQTTIACRC